MVYVEVSMIREVGINLKLPLRLLSAHALRVPRELLSRGIIGLTFLLCFQTYVKSLTFSDDSGFKMDFLARSVDVSFSRQSWTG